jgi:hypothetical protein
LYCSGKTEGSEVFLPINVLEKTMMHRILFVLLPGLLPGGCTEEQQNRLTRLGATHDLVTKL